MFIKIMDISSIMDTQINVLDSVLYKHICVLLSLMMQGVNMVPLLKILLC